VAAETAPLFLHYSGVQGERLLDIVLVAPAPRIDRVIPGK
jgi:hypothetical protein